MSSNVDSKDAADEGQPPAKKLAEEIEQKETAALFDASAKQQNDILDEVNICICLYKVQFNSSTILFAINIFGHNVE